MIKDGCVGGYAREPIKKICKYLVSMRRVMELLHNFNPLVECGYCILPFDAFYPALLKIQASRQEAGSIVKVSYRLGT